MKRLRKSKLSLFTILLAVFLTYFIYLYSSQAKIIQNKKEDLSDINQRIAEETKVQAKLNESLKEVHSDEEINKAARNKLGLVKMGERIFIDSNQN
jgi:cell division protein FtsB